MNGPKPKKTEWMLHRIVLHAHHMQIIYIYMPIPTYYILDIIYSAHNVSRFASVRYARDSGV